MSLQGPHDAHQQQPGSEITVNQSLFCFQPTSGVTSSGIFVGDDPLKFYYPVLVHHIFVVFVISRGIHAVLRRANFPLVISQILVSISIADRLSVVTDK